MIKGLNHVGISVADLERSIAFYRDMIGMEVLGQGPFDGEQYQRIMGLDGAQGRAVILQRPGLRLELFEFSRPTPRPGEPNRPVCDHGITHFCIEVADIDCEYRRLKTVGVQFHCPPLDFFGTAKATYARDLDGNVIELLEVTNKV